MKSGKVTHFNSNKNQQKSSNNAIIQPTNRQTTNKMLPFKHTQNNMTESTMNQKQKQETPAKISKPASFAWTFFFQSQANASAHSQSNLPPPPAKPPKNISNNQNLKTKTNTIPQPNIQKIEPKQSHFLLYDANNSHIDKSYLF